MLRLRVGGEPQGEKRRKKKKEEEKKRKKDNEERRSPCWGKNLKIMAMCIGMANYIMGLLGGK